MIITYVLLFLICFNSFLACLNCFDDILTKMSFFSNLKIYILITPNLDIADDTRITIVGWGVIGKGKDGTEIEPARAQKGNLNLIPGESCVYWLQEHLFDEKYHFCYGCVKGS